MDRLGKTRRDNVGKAGRNGHGKELPLASLIHLFYDLEYRKGNRVGEGYGAREEPT